MIIRLRKIHAVFCLSVVVGVLFLLALRADPTRQVLSAPQTRSLPIVMYHHVLRDEQRAGAYVLPERQLKEDFAFLKQCGYTSVCVEDLLQFVRGEKELPEKIVMLTFDDGYQSMDTYVLPLLQAYGMQAVLSVVGQFAQTYSDNGDSNVNYACLSWNALKRLADSGCFELQNHTYALHQARKGGRKGLTQQKGESDDDYRTMLTQDLEKNQRAILANAGVSPRALVYPFGAFSSGTLQIAKDCGFSCTLTCAQKINTVAMGDPNCLFQLGRFNRAAGENSEAFFAKLGIHNSAGGT